MLRDHQHSVNRLCRTTTRIDDNHSHQTRHSVILVNRSSRFRATLFSRLIVSRASSRFANGSMSSSSARYLGESVVETVTAWKPVLAFRQAYCRVLAINGMTWHCEIILHRLAI